jgi:hypothetical protein
VSQMRKCTECGDVSREFYMDSGTCKKCFSASIASRVALRKNPEYLRKQRITQLAWRQRKKQQQVPV